MSENSIEVLKKVINNQEILIEFFVETFGRKRREYFSGKPRDIHFYCVQGEGRVRIELENGINEMNNRKVEEIEMEYELFKSATII